MINLRPDQEQTQLAFDNPPTQAVDDATAAILDLVHGDPLHERDRQAVVEAIRTVGRRHHGEVDPNLVRAELPPWVFPRIVGPTYRALVLAGVLELDGWTTSDDLKGRNSGRPLRCYRLAGRWSQ